MLARVGGGEFFGRGVVSAGVRLRGWRLGDALPRYSFFLVLFCLGWLDGAGWVFGLGCLTGCFLKAVWGLGREGTEGKGK